MPLHLDFESRSQLDLKKVGLYRYATHPSTEIWCACLILEDEGDLWPERSDIYWLPRMKDPPNEYLWAVESGAIIYAHNAAFELALLTNILGPRYGWPVPPINRFRCTAAMAAAMSLPRDLERAAIAVGLSEKKDMSGRRLMLQMSKPREIKPDGTVVWWDDEEKLARLTEYCLQDVRTENSLSRRLRPLSAKEQVLWELDNKINRRGVAVDLASVDRAQATVEKELERLNAEIADLTAGFVRTVNQVSVIKSWLESRGVTVPSLNKTDVAEALDNDYLWQSDIDPEEGVLLDLLDELPPTKAIERRVLEIRQEAAKSSTAKLKRFKERAEKIDGHARCRENFLFDGAGTGRWAGLGLQLQNFPRGALNLDIEDVEDALAHLSDRTYLDVLYGPPLTVISDCLRSLITAPLGKELIDADYSAIEGRGLPWLAGDERKLSIFREQDAGGVGVYERTAAGILNKNPKDITKAERQAYGKVPELALGYGGGVGAFQSMAKNYRVSVKDEEADVIKLAWRDQHPKIVAYWYELEHAGLAAVRSPGTRHSVGAEGRKVTFLVQGKVLWLRLPSGRVLAYPSPSVKPVRTPWGGNKDAVCYYGIDAKTKQWCLQKTYGGFWSENICQSTCRDLLAEAIVRLEAANYPVVLHAHDEICCEIPEGFGSLEEFCAIMTELPAWAAGMPVVAAGWRGKRYRKG